MDEEKYRAGRASCGVNTAALEVRAIERPSILGVLTSQLFHSLTDVEHAGLQGFQNQFTE